MELIVLIGILLAVFLVEIIYYRLHALENLNLKVDFSKNIADYGEDIELIEVAENRKRLPLPTPMMPRPTSGWRSSRISGFLC